MSSSPLLFRYKMSLSFLGKYKRRLYGKSRFIWTTDTLSIIIRGLFQFHRSGRKLPLHDIAPHLRSLIREHVKNDVCVWDEKYHHWSADHFDRICARWVRLPSIRAVLLKLQECSVFAYLVSSTEASYRSLHDDGMMSDMFYRAMTFEMSRMERYSHYRCSASLLPAVPLPSSQPSWGSCFYCGSGLTDKIDLNLIPKCSCIGDVGEEICVCSSCIDEITDD